MSNRYSKYPFIQPTRKINFAVTDIYHTLKLGENLDELAYKYYKDPSLSWIIMCANPTFNFEWEIPISARLRIPFPLNRVFEQFGIENEI